MGTRLVGRSRREDGDAAPRPPAEEAVDRRAFIVSGAVAFTAFSGGVGWIFAPPEGAAAPAAESFQRISGFLTGRAEHFALAERAFTQLTALDAEFPAKVEALDEAVRGSGTESIDGFVSHRH